MHPQQETKVAIVKSNAALGSSLKQVVETSTHRRVVGIWTSGGEALKSIGSLRPQVILMDIDLPDFSGIEVAARIKQLLPDAEILMITLSRDQNKVLAALRAGASGYFLKGSSSAMVHAAISDVLMSAEITRRIAAPLDPSGRASVSEFELSNREFEVLARLSEGLGNQEIADRLGLSIETIRVHLKRIYKKLDVTSRTQALLKFRSSLYV